MDSQTKKADWKIRCPTALSGAPRDVHWCRVHGWLGASIFSLSNGFCITRARNSTTEGRPQGRQAPPLQLSERSVSGASHGRR